MIDGRLHCEDVKLIGYVKPIRELVSTTRNTSFSVKEFKTNVSLVKWHKRGITT